MGCLWSSQGDSGLQCRRCARIGNNDLIIINRVCEFCIRDVTRKQELQSSTSSRPYYGVYICPCGRTWNSRLSWLHAYQNCRVCNRSVYPHTQRELRKSDILHKGHSVHEHPQDLCQMCKQLGFHCGGASRRYNNRRKSNKNNFI